MFTPSDVGQARSHRTCGRSLKDLLSSGGRSKVGGRQTVLLVCVLFAMIGQQSNAFAHDGEVACVAYSPDGKRIVSGSRDKTAKVWDAEKGTEILALKGHTGAVLSVAYSPDGTRILTGSWDKTVKVWDAQKGTEILSLERHKGEVSSVAFSPDGRRILTGSYNWTAKVWDAQVGTELLSLDGHTHSVLSVAFSPDGTRILTGCEDKTAKVWDVEKGTEVFSLIGHTSAVTSVAFSPDGKHLVTGSFDKTARVWDAQKGTLVFFLMGHTHSIKGVAFSPDGKRVASASHDSVRVWEAESGRELLYINGYTYATGVAFSPDGDRIAAGSTRDAVWVFDASSGQLLTVLGNPSWWQRLQNRIVSPSLDTHSVCILCCACFGLVVVVFMRYRMSQPTPSSWAVLFYKLWHFPVFLVGNMFYRAFWGVIVLVLVCVLALAVLVVVGYVVGSLVGGLAGALIGGIVGLVAGWLFSEYVFTQAFAPGHNDHYRPDDGSLRGYLKALKQDMLTDSTELHTMDRAYVFTLLCAIQSVLLLGVAGALLGTYVADQTVSPVPLAIVSAFFGLFVAQVLAFLKKQTTGVAQGLALGGLQTVVVGFLLLPAKRLLADQSVAGAFFDQFADLFDGQLGLYGVFVALVGGVTHFFTSFVAGRK